MPEPTPAQVMKKMKTLPKELLFTDENDVPLDDSPPLVLSAGERWALAHAMLKQKQSLETIVRRALSSHLKRVRKEHPDVFGD